MGLDHILNIRKLAEKVTGEKMSAVYYQLNDAFKGNVVNIELGTLQRAKKELLKQHADALALLNTMEKEAKEKRKAAK